MPIIEDVRRRSLEETGEETNSSGFIILNSGGYLLLNTGDKILKNQ